MPVLGYWKLRGYAQPIRLMLGYLEIDFEDKMYEIGDAPEFNRDAWLSEKFSLGLDFPNLPYYFDGDVKMSQSKAIMRHIARKHDLLGKTEQEKDRCDEVAEQITDLRMAFGRMCYDVYYGGNFKVKGPTYIENLTKTLIPYQSFLGDNPWLAGANITWADFLMWEVLDQHLLFKPGCLDDLPELAAYHQRFKEEPRIQKFMESSKFFVGACMGPMAAWGGSFPVLPATFE